MKWPKIRPFFAWFDIWIGFYYDRKQKCLYFLPIPMVGLKIQFNPLPCDDCKAVSQCTDNGCLRSRGIYEWWMDQPWE